MNRTDPLSLIFDVCKESGVKIRRKNAVRDEKRMSVREEQKAYERKREGGLMKFFSKEKFLLRRKDHKFISSRSL